VRTTLASAICKAGAVTLVLAGFATAPAFGAGPTSTNPPAISGLPEVGQTLTVSTGTWSGAAPMSFAHQWQRCVGALYASEVLRDGPTAYYRLGDAAESPDVTDATGSEQLGTFRNGVLQEVDGGLFEDGDGAAGFDGVDDYADVPDGSGFDLGDSFTLEAWIRPVGGRATTILDKGAGAYALRLTSGNKVVLTKPGAGDVSAAAVAVPLDGAFHHVVATKSGSATRLYLDGADVTAAVTNRTIANGASALRIGTAHQPLAGEGPYAGELDEIALYRGPLAAVRVRAHFDVGSSGCVGIAGARGSSYTLTPADYGATVRALVTATDAGGATTAASGDTAVVTTQSPVNVEAPVVWGETVVGRQLAAGEGAWAGKEPLAYSFQWQSCLDRRYRATVLADSPHGYWRLGELAGSTASDDSGKGNKGTYANGVTLGVRGALSGSADTNRAARFDGLNDHVTVPDRSSLDLGDSLTIEEWVHRDVTGVKGQIVQKGVGGYALRVDPDDRAHFAKSNMGDIAVSSVAIPADGSFHHVVATKSGAAIRIYLDGADVTQVIANRTIADTSAPFQIGRFLNQGAASLYYAGDLDEVAVYDQALSAARVRAHHAMGTSGCTDVAGATGTGYTPTVADLGKRLRVVVTAQNGVGAASAASARSPALVSTSGGPVIASGTLTDASGNPVPNATVSLYLWPAQTDSVPVGGAAGTQLVAQTTSDANGNYALEGALTPAVQAEADANGGVANFELRAAAPGFQYESFIERDFGSPGGASLMLAGEGLAEAQAMWEDSVTGLPAASVNAVLGPGEDGVASLQADPPNDGVECSNWDKTFGIWKKTGQGESYTRVGELHTWSSMTNRFAYGTRADSDIDVAFKTPTSRWHVSGSVHVGNSSGQSTSAGQTATTGPGEYTSRAVKARFIYTHWYQCGTGNKKTRAAKWNGYNLAKGAGVSSRDGECSELVNHIFSPRQDWTRDRNRATYWGAAADLGFFIVGARSGFSRWVTSQWWFGSTLASTTLCGVSKPPGQARRVFAGW